ncbi:phosphotransferase [Streptomyces sp. NPDC002550]
MTARTVVAEYGSALVRTKILAGAQGGGRFTWIRTPGAARSGPPQQPPRALLATFTALEHASATDGGPGVRCVLPRVYGSEGGRNYPLPGRRSLAELLLSGNPPSTEDMLRGLGRLLRALHAAPLPTAGAADAFAPPDAWRRLRSWVDSPAAGRSTQLHCYLRELLGTSRWRRVEEWLSELPEAVPRTLVHGAPGLGLLVPAEVPGSPHGLITGEDIGITAWQWDIGWVLAELRELRFFATRLHRPKSDWKRLEHSFLSGYGRPCDPLVQRSTVLRSLLHLHDFSVFVTWDETEVRRYAALVVYTMEAADLMDEQEGVR